MLEVRCGIADRSHENRFFRYFASQLKEYFERIGVKGILVGMPECKVMGNLQMDALLITDSSLTIIDFKDYTDCEVCLPDERDFERGRWATSKGFYVRGGSSPNPYAQLMLQRSRLKEILNRFCRHKIGDFNAGHISTMVCFTGHVTIDGDIPGWAKLKFFIADSESFLVRLYDIVNVRGAGLLQSDFVTNKFGELFEAQPYECEIIPSKPFIPEVHSEQAPKAMDENADNIRRFFAGDSDVLIVASIDSLERQRLAQIAQEEAHAKGFDEATILSPTKLAGYNLCSGLQLDGSLYSEIYDFNSKTKDVDGVDHIGLRKPPNGYSLRCEEEPSKTEDADAGKPSRERIAFVVCESQLVSSNAWVDGSVVFGSGRLLADVLEYLSIDEDNNGNNKVVFIGDDCQLGANSHNSSMQVAAYPEGVSVEKVLIPVLDLEGKRADLIQSLAAGIRQTEYSLLCADRSVDNPRIARRDEQRSLIEDVATNWRTHRIIAFDNEKATQLNLFIKRSVLRNGEALSENDVLLLNGQFEALACDPFSEACPTRVFRNGEFIRISHVGNVVMEVPVGEPSNKPQELLSIVPIRFFPEGSNEEYKAWLALEYLYVDKPKMTAALEKAIQIRLSTLEREVRSKNPFAPGNRWYDLMVEEGNYDEILRKSGEIVYRQKRDRRKLTRQEREYSDELKSPGSQYYLLSNLVRARYGWAITAHKAQYGRWDTITLTADAGMQKHNDGYFRYLYTGATRAIEQLNVVKWVDVNPFDDAFFDTHPSNLRKKAKRSILFKASSDLPIKQQIADYIGRINLPDIAVCYLASSSWREAFAVKRGDAEATIAFDYNKVLEVYPPRLEKGDSHLFGEFSKALSVNEAGSNQDSPMLFAYRYAQDCSCGQTSIHIQKASPYRDEIRVENEVGVFYATVHYGANKAATRIELQSGSSDAFLSFNRLLVPAEQPLSSLGVQ